MFGCMHQRHRRAGGRQGRYPSEDDL
jgi:hypothetical protein